VLINDQVAEHVPGCNMAFRRAALLSINGFDEQYRQAGDDVDICWRLQQAGLWITFAPGALVWHHRRQTPAAYLRQQAGYGTAEAMLRFQHPDRFNDWGEGKWNGVLYGPSPRGVALDRPMIYYGLFGAGLFQCLYQPRRADWMMLPGTLEWHGAIALICLTAPHWPAVALIAVSVMWSLSLLVAAAQARRARLERRYDGLSSRLLIMGLCYLQMLVRSWSRQKARLFAYRQPIGVLPVDSPLPWTFPITLRHSAPYWSERGQERTELLAHVIGLLDEHRWSKNLDTGWENWDLEVSCHPWSVVRIATAQENHGEGKRLIRVRYRVRPSGYVQALWVFGALVAVDGIGFQSWTLAAGAALLLAGTAAFYRGVARAKRAIALVDAAAAHMKLTRCGRRRKPAAGDNGEARSC
jgi:hypothetical protein